MKKLMVLVLSFSISGMAIAQNVIDEKFASYKSKENYTKVSVTGKMFEMASNVEIEESTQEVENIKELLSGIESFNMILGTEESETKSKYLQGLSKIQIDYEELMSVDDKQGRFSFYIDENNGVVHELVMIGASPDKFMVASLKGRMDLRKLGEITKQIQKQGVQPMSMMFDEGTDNFKVYPNPASVGESIVVKAPSNLIGGQAKMYDLSGRIVHEWHIENETQRINTSNLDHGRYVVELTKDKVRMKKKVILQ